MQFSSCVRNPVTFQVAIPANTTLRLLKRNICQLLLYHSKREWFFSPVMMEVNNGIPRSHEKRPLEGSTSANEATKPTENNASTSVFVNHAAIAWHEKRREWIGDQTQKLQRLPKDPIISWSMTYEDLLSTKEPFAEPIPLPEMVDFLVDIWYDEGLYD
uniref:Gag1-like clamp domain-containing protein n=1 Tax=Davidia involucrata TaxID=16924 RepID=A0A5B7AT18_DAVIN